MESKYFKHYTGNLYKFICFARNNVNMEDVVVYQSMFGEQKVWTMPTELFFGDIEHNGTVVKRFVDVTSVEP